MNVDAEIDSINNSKWNLHLVEVNKDTMANYGMQDVSTPRNELLRSEVRKILPINLQKNAGLIRTSIYVAKAQHK